MKLTVPAIRVPGPAPTARAPLTRPRSCSTPSTRFWPRAWPKHPFANWRCGAGRQWPCTRLRELSKVAVQSGPSRPPQPELSRPELARPELARLASVPRHREQALHAAQLG